jgi:citrate synthase
MAGAQDKSRRPLRSEIAWSTSDRIGVLGHDLTRELMGKINLGEMAFLEVQRRLPDARESRMFNALLVTLVEHGIVPSTLAARLTYDGAPEAIQGAVAAGLLGLGSVFVGSTELVARMLLEGLPDPRADIALHVVAERIVSEHRAAGQHLPGFGHPVHKPVDPRTTRLFEIARETGFSGRYVELVQLVQETAQAASGKKLTLNATGAIGAICCEMGLPWTVCRGLGVMARAVGLVGHILEDSRNPIGLEIWHRVEEEASQDVRGRLRKDSA